MDINPIVEIYALGSFDHSIIVNEIIISTADLNHTLLIKNQ